MYDKEYLINKSNDGNHIVPASKPTTLLFHFMFGGETINTKFIVISLTQQGLETRIYDTRE